MERRLFNGGRCTLGRETIGSLFRPSRIARRQQSHCFSAFAGIEFKPDHVEQLAGLVCYCNSTRFHCLYLLHVKAVGKDPRVKSCAPDSAQADAL